MSIAMVKVTKSFKGERWDNTYCVCNHTDDISIDAPRLTQADVEVYTGGTVPTDASTNPTQSSYRGGTESTSGILHSILGFERRMHFEGIMIDSLTISDGRYDSVAFMTYSVGAYGLFTSTVGDGTAAGIIPGNVTVMLTRSAGLPNSKDGRLFMRGCARDIDATFDGFRLVGFDPDSELPNGIRNNHFGGSGTSPSHLNSYLWSSALHPSGAALRIPHFFPTTGGDGVAHMSLVSSAPWTAVGKIELRSRQVQKGKRRKV